MNRFFKSNFFRYIISSAIFFIFSIQSFALSQNKIAQNFWIWPQVQFQKYDQPENTLYILRGLFKNKKSHSIFFQQGDDLKDLKAQIVLVYRLQQLPDLQILKKVIIKDLKQWSHRNQKVIGIQFDYDSPTAKLNIYAEYLQQVRKFIDPKFQLSITGLADWLVNSSKKDLDQLQNSVNFIAFQMYTYGYSFSDIAKRVTDVEHLRYPFKIGFINTEDEKKYVPTVKNRHFNGSIVFIGSHQ